MTAIIVITFATDHYALNTALKILMAVAMVIMTVTVLLFISLLTMSILFCLFSSSIDEIPNVLGVPIFAFADFHARMFFWELLFF